MCHAFFFFKENKKVEEKQKQKLFDRCFLKCSRMQIKSTISII
jgi:hypothetical protein